MVKVRGLGTLFSGGKRVGKENKWESLWYVCLCRCEWSFYLVHGHEAFPERGLMVCFLLASLLEVDSPKWEFMTASCLRSGCFWSDKWRSEKTSVCCWISNLQLKIIFIPPMGFQVDPYSCQKKFHRLGGLKNRNLFCHSSAGYKSKTKALTVLVSSETSYPGFHMAFSLCMHIPGASQCVLISSYYKDTRQIELGTIFMASF